MATTHRFMLRIFTQLLLQVAFVTAKNTAAVTIFQRLRTPIGSGKCLRSKYEQKPRGSGR